MSDKTAIEWTDATWNPVRGCSLVSDGCKNCYAMNVANRFSGPGQPYDGLTIKTSQGAKWTGRVDLVRAMLDQPLKWTRPRKIFVNSMSDLFHGGVPDSYIDQVFAVMALAPQHMFQVLTKRPERMLAYLSAPNRADAIGSAELAIYEGHGKVLPRGAYQGPEHRRESWPLSNVWLGVSVEDQATADERIPLLLKMPAAVRWVSAEPLLGPVDLKSYLPRIDWVVVGGESGPKARPMHPDWARSLRDQCRAGIVAFMFKQWGEWVTTVKTESGNQIIVFGQCKFTNLPEFHEFPDYTLMARIGKKAAGRQLDGRTWDESAPFPF